MATQCFDEDLEDDVRVAEFEIHVPGTDPEMTPLPLAGNGPWEFSAGRDEARDIVINSTSVSGHHADIGALRAPPRPPPRPLVQTQALQTSPRPARSHRLAGRRLKVRSQGRAEEDDQRNAPE